jgi:hypothetical protein
MLLDEIVVGGEILETNKEKLMGKLSLNMMVLMSIVEASKFESMM